MSTKVQLSRQNPPFGVLLTARHVARAGGAVSVEWAGQTGLAVSAELTLTAPAAVCRQLARQAPDADRLYGDSALARTTADHWLAFSARLQAGAARLPDALAEFDAVLLTLSFLVGEAVSVADYAVWGALYGSGQFQALLAAGAVPANVLRWYRLIADQDVTRQVVESLPEELRPKAAAAGPAPTAAAAARKEEGKFVELPGAEMGKVVVRFPPEASGYLHIGHAKAALLNQYYQQAFKGQLIMRFDDTNPQKEKADFEKVILEDLQLLDIHPDRFTHSSDHFDTMLEMCRRLLLEGRAYVDDTDPEQMKAEREQMVESASRSNSVERNLQLWQEMLAGSEAGQRCCVRAKIDMKSPNGCMRDPTIYRCKPEPHVRTGTKYKAYPTYDFCCPIVDSVEGVTHALRTTEYHDRDDQYYWFIDALKLRKPYIYEYSRLNMTNTVLSKRKLTWFVENGLVSGWDDPRFPTVRGILRRGMTVEGLRQFIVAQGSSRAVVFMEWDKIWAFNKKVIDPVAPRFTAVPADGAVTVTVRGVTEQATEAAKHPKNPAVGTKTVWTGPRLLIDRADVDLLAEGQNATFINWGNLRIDKVVRGADDVAVEATPQLDNKDYKKTAKLTWLADTESAPLVPTVCVYYDHIISKPVLGKDEDFKQYIGHETRSEILMLGDPELAHVKQSEIIQIQRRGFFICDSPYRPASVHSGRESPCVLIYIPDGHSKEPAKTAASAKAGGTAAAKAGSPPKVEAAPASASELSDRIAAQGDKVRQLKSAKADKASVDAEVKTLLALKAGFKSATGQDWKPGIQVAQTQPQAAGPTGCSASDLSQRITAQGDKVRQLKSAKADKAAVDAEVKTLLSLKAEFKSATGQDWKPGIQVSQAQPQAASPTASSASDLSERIAAQGDKVRQLKSAKADKAAVDAEVKTLLALKAEFKTATGQDWKPGAQAAQAQASAPPPVAAAGVASAVELNQRITEQGDKVRKLKNDKADKSAIDSAVKELLALKAEFKTACGVDWKPGMTLPSAAATAAPAAGAGDAADLSQRIAAQGDKVRELKSAKADKAAVDAEVKTLLALKAEFKTATGQDWKPANSGSAARAPSGGKTAEKKPQPAKQQAKPKEAAVDDAAAKKQTRLGMEAKKEESLSDWYSQVITKSEMIEYYDVSGCYILRPWSYAIWEIIKDFFDAEIKKLGVENCYFPIFVSHSALEKEKTHIADFAPEVAWVTKSGDSELAEPIAIRPTSETVMYPSYARWIQSYRDLPLRLNQWCNVVRWEFKHPQPFLRTREFLWQEGHTAFATQKEAADEVLKILDLYRQIYEDLLAIPVIPGRKTEKEKFAGGDYTTTVEAYVGASGRAVQGGTSHHLGQNFSKMFEIVFEDPETQEKNYVFQNSWGLTTRTLGVMVMVHGDNQGLVLPPRVASVQVVVVPCGITASMKDADRDQLLAACGEYEAELKAAGVRCRADLRLNYSPGWKFNHWELKGVPLRLELGPRDLKQGQYVLVRRDTGAKAAYQRAGLAADVAEQLKAIQAAMFERAKRQQDEHVVVCHEFDDFCSKLDSKCLIQAPYCGEISCEEKIKKDSAREEAAEPGAPAMGAKGLCIPFIQPSGIAADAHCIHPACANKPKHYTLFGRSY